MEIGLVNHFSDQYESLLLGEKAAIGILEGIQLTFCEDHQFTLSST